MRGIYVWFVYDTSASYCFLLAKNIRCKLGLLESYQSYYVAMQQTQSAWPLKLVQLMETAKYQEYLRQQTLKPNCCGLPHSVDIGIIADTTSDLSFRCTVLALVASLGLTVSYRCYRCFPAASSQQLQLHTNHDYHGELRDAFHGIVQHLTTLHDCILCLTQCVYDPGILPGSAD